MSFEHDAFISYSHVDNKPLLKKKDGWVTVFDYALTRILNGFLRKKVSVWRDPKIKGNDDFTKEIVCRLPKAAVLISIVSPPYVQSEWAAKELLGFYEAAVQNHGLTIGEKSRIFKVLKSPIEKEDPFPPPVGEEMNRSLGYPFYRLDEETEKLEVYDPVYGEEAEKKFLARVNELAWDMTLLIQKLAGVITAKPKPAVYLAECARDRREARSLIAAELKRSGYDILPERDLPREEAAFNAEVERLLAKCVLSVHLIGSGYGEGLDGLTDKSRVILQNEIAVRVARNGDLKRIISLPAETRGANPAQQAFIDALHSDADLQFGADIIPGGTEELKSTIATALQKLEEGAEKPAAQPNPAETLVYVLCDSRDLNADPNATVPLVKALRERGARVELTKFDGEAAKVREANQELMMNADTVVLFYGAGDETWKYFQLREIIKMRGLGRETPPRTRIYLSRPFTPEKELLLQTDKSAIDGRNGLSDQALASLLGD